MSNPIGTVLASILQPSDFLRAVPSGERWVLANGADLRSDEASPLIRIIQNSAYYAELNTHNVAKAPDLRGVFLRGKNNARDAGEANAEGDLPVGKYQPDDVGPHTHAYVHGYANSNSAGAGAPVRQGDGGTQTSPPTGEPGQRRPREESRPRNVTVNFYIRVA